MTAREPRLLLFACSARKRRDAGPLPAIERYDGPAFRVLRRYLARAGDTALCVHILSARYGVIPAAMPLPAYDERLTATRAVALRPEIERTLAAVVGRQRWQSCFIYGGRAYYALMASVLVALDSAPPVARPDGPPGVRLARLRAWLDGGTSADESAAAVGGTVPRLRGVRVDLTAEQALARLRETLASASGGSESAAVWVVDMESALLPAKRAASVLTGLPKTAFGTTEAVRLLRQLGLTVGQQ